MATFNDPVQPAAELATYLLNRRDAILNKWRTACEQDSSLPHIASLTRDEFNNMLPLILNILGQRLRDMPVEADPTQVASAHGLHRWHKGRSLRNLLTELDHLYQILSDELQLYRQLYPEKDLAILLSAAEQIARLKSETIEGSATEYDAQQQLSAASRSDGLQQALNQLNQLGRERSDLLRTSSHDLKSSFGLISGSTQLLKQTGKTDQERAHLVDILNRNLTNVQTMLVQLTDLARLEAGQESLTIEPFDAAQVLRELVASAQSLVSEKGLVLWADGPDSLLVKSDLVKVQRIVQNLLLNAIRYTPKGMISVSWSSESTYRWYISVQDSGPGLPAGLVSLLAGQLEPSIEPGAVLKRDLTTDPIDLPPTDPTSVESGNKVQGGEGIGLHIVKRLCELLGASLDVETQPGNGTLFRIRLLIEQDS